MVLESEPQKGPEINTPHTSRLPLVVAIALMAISVVELAQNYFQWSVLRAAQLYYFNPFTPGFWWIKNDVGDSRYILYIMIGLAVSAASLIFLLLMARREKRRPNY